MTNWIAKSASAIGAGSSLGRKLQPARDSKVARYKAEDDGCPMQVDVKRSGSRKQGHSPVERKETGDEYFHNDPDGY
ncbi:hypothetical protein Pla108_07310 [Botrimarina colliarenosi]|uniref:Uncharacterized protein n=1 Tax=Botrimarina colliarenosi TaxID=2528001 RepID=A0A5C6AKK2_9BACT|nr:hypothetical protein [Botrimarina colliarenosi]TWT99788.1 hypothetical protein Pla108_07310 [Botrimarina colliarenosi]